MSLSRPVQISRALADSVDLQEFGTPVTHVYNPLRYARNSHEKYLRAFANKGVNALLLGMNPGPWGMAQTGVPFGQVQAVRDWMGISGNVAQPDQVHPKRPIEGFSCERSEVSGARLWGWAQERYGTPEAFFERFFVCNYCPLSFMEESGRNFTPDKLCKTEQAPLFEACNDALRDLVEYLQPKYVLGVGAFAERQIRRAVPDFPGCVGRILHPSPASPAANRGWAAAAERDLEALGISL